MQAVIKVITYTVHMIYIHITVPLGTCYYNKAKPVNTGNQHHQGIKMQKNPRSEVT